jgi:pimeloyl-ACP methyl ester carboxylesterase
MRLLFHSLLRMGEGLIILLVILSLYNLWATKRDADLFTPPGQMVDLGGYKLHIHCIEPSSPSFASSDHHQLHPDAGNSEIITEDEEPEKEEVEDEEEEKEWPTVIFDHALMSLSQQYYRVLSYPTLTKRARVCLVDRAGYGFSEEGPYPRTPAKQAEELHQLLVGAGLHPPFVLVGHSRGGLNQLVYASKFAKNNEVAGLVLIDTSPPGFELPQALKRLEGIVEFGLKLVPYFVKLGIVRLVNFIAAHVRSDDAIHTYRAEDLDFKNWVDSKPSYWATVLSEFQQGDEALVIAQEEDNIKRQNWEFPIRVVSAGLFPSAFTKDVLDNWGRGMDRLAAYSTNGKVLVAQDSPHDVPAHQPEIIVQAIIEVLEANQNKESNRDEDAR